MSSPFQYGGQAVIEGVMMRGPDTRAVAVRRPDQTIVVDEKMVGSLTRRFPVLKAPLVRGVVVLIEALVLGIEALTFSASQATGEEEELTPWEIIITVGIALAMAVLLFAFLPVAAAHLLNSVAPGAFIQNLIEGLFRIAIFLAYVVAIGRMADIRRVFQYHGAEHKAINTYEDGAELTVEEVSKRSRQHPSCGTSFILYVLVISIIVFSFLGNGHWWWKFGSRLLLLPLIAGLGYEFIRLSRRYRKQMRFFIAPGLWVQNLTTGEPDPGQIEVAIAALKSVLVPPPGAAASGD